MIKVTLRMVPVNTATLFFPFFFLSDVIETPLYLPPSPLLLEGVNILLGPLNSYIFILRVIRES